jgi:hypothetical protein
LRAIAALRSPHLALVRPARIGLGFESTGVSQKTLLEIEELLGGPGRLSLPYSLRLLLDVLTGLGVLHRTLGFVHGEVQPEHVILGEDGVGRLMPVVRAHWVRGEARAPERLYYLAPEKLLGDSVDIRSDVYSVGVMLWEALSGQRLLEAYEVDDIIARLMGGGIPRAHAPEAEAWTAPLTGIAERAMAVDPGRRFASVAEMKDAIESACSRYLASAPGMAELFADPERRARSHVRESIAPESQRVTLPPTHQNPNQNQSTTYPRVSTPTKVADISSFDAAALDAAAERLSRSSMASIDLEDELTTKPNAAPLPTARKGAHVNTLLGVPMPYVEREPSPPDELTNPLGRIPPSTPVIITPLPLPPSSPLGVNMPPPAPLPPPAAASAPPPAFLHAQVRPSVPVESRRAPSLSPLIAAPAREPQPTVAEPSFELTRARKGRGAVWLVLGAVAAIGLFAARPWLARQVAAATGALPDNAATNLDRAAAPTPPQPSANANAAPEMSAAPASAVGIASTPPMPSAQGGAAQHGGGSREEHIVIHDSVEPSVNEGASPTPIATPPAPVAAPPAAPAPPAPKEPAPASPPATRKSKEVPVSDADRYGI